MYIKLISVWYDMSNFVHDAGNSSTVQCQEVILKFQINDQFALIQFALAVQVIEWGQSM